MPATPRSSAIAPASASITRVNDVRAIDLLTIASSVRTPASGRLGFTDHTARPTSLVNALDPARELRITYDIVRRTDGLSPSNPVISIGNTATVGAFLSTPSLRSSLTTPTISRQSDELLSRICLPSAAAGEPHISRARLSETIATLRLS